MSSENSQYLLDRLKLRYRVLRLVEILFVAGDVVLMTLAVSTLLVPVSNTAITVSLIAGIVVFVIRFRHYNLHHLGHSNLISYLNSNYPQLRESADLIMRDDSGLTNLARLQKQIIIREFNQLYPQIKVPQLVWQSFGIFAVCAASYFILSGFSSAQKKDSLSATARTNEIEIKDTIPASLLSFSISVQAPAYTAIKEVATDKPNLVTAEGSSVTWRINFSKSVTGGKIIFSGRDSAALVNTLPTSYTFKKILNESGFYQIQWHTEGRTVRSDFYRIEIIPDEPPKVSINNLEQFTRLTLQDNLEVAVSSNLADDYGLKDADIIATVSKGSGESVKFREEKLRFNSPAIISGKQVHATTTLNLRKLGLEPGDEIYFYVEAFDNKTPTANRNRTETFFIALQDTTTEIIATDDGLGVDLMPEYFRSQRQIIIDTEKLLREKKKLTKHQFNSTSNELGYDQKVLRLRYGQFLGEEAESGIGLAAVHEAEGGDDADEDDDPIKKFGHAHDTKNEHNLVDDKKTKMPHHHEGEVKDPNAKEDPLEEFIHQHDNTEEATFFIQSVRAKLKAALSIMWDAELHLRLYDPAKSLPYQYKALNLLKEISNDSRIYVHRTGFDPAPLKEEKRLTADLSEVKNFTDRNTAEEKEQYPDIRLGLAVIEQMLVTKQSQVSPKDQIILNRAGQELAGLAVEHPGLHLGGLSLLKSLSENKIQAKEMRDALLLMRAGFWNALPRKTSTPSGSGITGNKLDQAFIRQLESIKHD